MRSFARRRFLCFLGGAGALASLSTAAFVKQPPLSDEGNTARRELPLDQLQPVTRSGWALGSTVSMTVLYPNRVTASRVTAFRAMDAAFDELERIEDLMSIYRPSSQLSQLNRTGKLAHADPCLLEVLRFAQHTSLRSRGAFDVTVQPLWQLFRSAERDGRRPTLREVRAARSCVDWRRVELAPDRVQLHGSQTQLTLNGLAQGYAADRVRRVLRSYGIEHALIDTGEIGTLGAKTSSDGWTIGIQHPREQQAYLSTAQLAGRCLATSGDYATAFGPGYEDHHLFDPHTGYSPRELCSVTIAAETALEADAFSTAVFVLGRDAGAQLIAQSPGIDALLVSKDGHTFSTPGFPSSQLV